MEYSFETIDNVLKVTLDGRLVAACTEEFKEIMLSKMLESKAILFDLSKMAHIDSSGLGALVLLLQKGSAAGITIKLACIQPRPKIVFDITKVYKVFDIYDTVEAALASFKA